MNININVDVAALDDAALLDFLASLHAARLADVIHPSNCRLAESIHGHAQAEAARRIFMPWWAPDYAAWL